MSAKTLLQRLRASRLTGNFFVYSVDFGLRVLVQLLYFLMIVRFLGPSGYGVFASVTAITLLASTVSGIGSDQVLIRRVTRDKEPFPLAFGNALSAIAVTLPVIVPITLGVVLMLDHGNMSVTAILIIIVADVMLNRATALANAAFQAHERAPQQLAINLSSSVLKLVATACAWVFSEPLTLNAWAGWYAASSGLSGALALVMVGKYLGAPKAAFYPRDLGDGLIYAMESASLSALRDLDKPVVVETLGAAQGGYYTAAFRIVDMACIPVRALLYATYTRYFHHGSAGQAQAIAFARALLPLMGGLSGLISICLLLAAPLVPTVLGDEYAPVVPVIRSLAVYPMLLALSAMGGDLLRALSLQRERLIVMLFTTLTYVPIVWAGAHLMGAEGAALARNLSQLFLLLATMLFILRVARRTNSGAETAFRTPRADRAGSPTDDAMPRDLQLKPATTNPSARA